MEEIEGSDALLTEILVRLPLRDVITFKRVSKRWLSLISDPYFSRCRVTVQRTRFSGLILDPDIFHRPQHRELTFFYFNKKIRRPCRRQRIFCPKVPDNCSYILQSCNGLMLLRRFSDRFIYNPTTGDKKPLPSPFPSVDPSDFRYSLAFDPLRFHGYKLICVFPGKSSKKDGYQTMIYSSESRAWKHCGSSFSSPKDMDFVRGVYFKESVYWIGNKSKTTLRFDLMEECVKDDMPRLPPEPPDDHNVAVSSYLNIVRIYSGLGNTRYGYILAPACGYMNLVGFNFKFCMRVFRLKEDYYSSSRSWVLMYSVDLRRTNLKRILNINVAENSNAVRFDYSILHLIEDGEDEMALLLQIHGKVIALRLKDHTRYEVLDLDIKLKGSNSLRYFNFPRVMGWYRAFEYVESLACV